MRLQMTKRILERAPNHPENKGEKQCRHNGRLERAVFVSTQDQIADVLLVGAGQVARAQPIRGGAKFAGPLGIDRPQAKPHMHHGWQ